MQSNSQLLSVDTTKSNDMIVKTFLAQERLPTSVKFKHRRILAGLTGVFIVAILCVTLAIDHHKRVMKEYSGSAGKEILVELKGVNNSDFAESLENSGIISHAQLFINLIQNQPLRAGYYVLPQHISSQYALDLILAQKAQVGKITIPPGYTLADHQNNKGKTVPGIFTMIAAASCITFDGIQKCYTTVPDLVAAAQNADDRQLAVPPWESAAFHALAHDPRKIEGLIAAGTFDTINPEEPAVNKLHDLIEQSVQLYQHEGITNPGESDLGPYTASYQRLIIASIAEREAGNARDYGKIVRVIYNRLNSHPAMRLDMDSTINYFFGKSSFDFTPTELNDPNPWNTRLHDGLPPTPVGTPSPQAIAATLNPPPGNWKFFVTIDAKGTTLFADTYEQQQINQAHACVNHFLTTQCEFN